jgi:hypothetical protein
LNTPYATSRATDVDTSLLDAARLSSAFSHVADARPSVVVRVVAPSSTLRASRSSAAASSHIRAISVATTNDVDDDDDDDDDVDGSRIARSDVISTSIAALLARPPQSRARHDDASPPRARRGHRPSAPDDDDADADADVIAPPPCARVAVCGGDVCRVYTHTSRTGHWTTFLDADACDHVPQTVSREEYCRRVL